MLCKRYVSHVDFFLKTVMSCDTVEGDNKFYVYKIDEGKAIHINISK